MDTQNVELSMKKSKAFYAVIIYGFIGIFAMIIMPFIPFSDYGSFIGYGFDFIDGRYAIQTIIPVLTLLHTLYVLIMGITLLNKLKNFRACAIRSFYTYFRASFLILFGFFTIYYMACGGANSISYMTFERSYASIYFYIVLGIYGAGLFFTFLASMSKKQLRPDKYSAIYHYGLLFLVGLLVLFFLLRGEDVLSRYVGASGRRKIIERITEINIYLNSVLVYFALWFTSCLCMPINKPFQHMYFKDLKGEKKARLNQKVYIPIAFVGFVMFIVYLAIGANKDVINAIFLMLFAAIGYTAAFFYNKYVAKRVQKPQQLEFTGFFKDENAQASTEVKKGKKLCWKIKNLEELNGRFDFKARTTIEKTSAGLQKSILSNKVQIMEEDVQKILSSVLADKVTFIKTDAPERTIKALSNGIAKYFGEDLFIERREDKTLENTNLIPEQAVEPIKEQATPEGETAPITENQPEVQDTATINQAETQAVAENTEAVPMQEETQENEQKLSEVASSEAKDEIKAEPPKIEDNKEEVELTEEEKLIRLRKIQKYNITSGLFVANYLYNVLGLTFLDLSQLSEIGDKDKAFIEAIINNEDKIYCETVDFLPKSQNVVGSFVKNPENLRLIVFVNDEDGKKLEPEWIKYSSVVDLPFSYNEQITEDGEYKVETSYSMINQMLEEALENHYILEESWRKIDSLEEYLKSKVNIEFDNRFIRQMERNLAIALACGMDKTHALDAILAEKVIPYVATFKDQIVNVSSFDFDIKMDEIFGFENIPLTKKEMAIYGLNKQALKRGKLNG